MILPGSQTTTFFEDFSHKGIPHPTMIQLQEEYIIIVDDISDFDKTTIEQLAVNLRRPAGRVEDPEHSDNAYTMIPTPLFVFGARSRTRLGTDAELVRYYETVNCTITVSNMTWSQTVKNFQVQWKSLEEKKNNYKPNIPAIMKAFPVIKWTKPFRYYPHCRVGARTLPLAYVVRSNADVPMIRDIETGKP